MPLSYTLVLGQAPSVISTSGRNLYILDRGKISPAGRNDTLLIKLSILSVAALVENTATHGGLVRFL